MRKKFLGCALATALSVLGLVRYLKVLRENVQHALVLFRFVCHPIQRIKKLRGDF